MALNKSKLESMYHKQKMSLRKIAESQGVCTQTILNWMKMYSIPRRSLSDAWYNKQNIPELAEKMRQGAKSFAGQSRWNWKAPGSKRETTEGYTVVKTEGHPRGQWIGEHVLIMEKFIGRYLEKGEEIHHKNRDKKDNRIENLELFSSHSDHMLSFNHRKGGCL